LQTLYEEMRERAERADRERKEKGALTHAQKQLLEYHKQISMHKLQAVEAKYSALKKAHLGLEVSSSSP
jgi:chromosome segregation ATPase